MTLEIVTVTVSASEVDRYLATYLQVRQLLAADPHCLGFSMNRCLEEPERFVVLVEWDSLEGHLAFRRTPAYEEFRARILPFYLSSEIKHYERVHFAEVAGHGV